jgi:hypothetical protein
MVYQLFVDLTSTDAIDVRKSVFHLHVCDRRLSPGQGIRHWPQRRLCCPDERFGSCSLRSQELTYGGRKPAKCNAALLEAARRGKKFASLSLLQVRPTGPEISMPRLPDGVPAAVIASHLVSENSHDAET